MLLSVVVPVFNEKENIKPMLKALDEALTSLEHEIIFVDDGSTDGTVKKISELAKPHVRCIVFPRNYGQTSAMAAGIDQANGEFIATLDGDLQNDPADIPKMLEKLQKEGLDIVAGIRANRKDGALLRKLPSKLANKLIRKLTHVEISDYGCTLKVFRAEMAKNLDLYGELHRFIPILGRLNGAKIAEMDVKHHSRAFGRSKYGLGRTFRVLSDLLLMVFFLKYRQKPMHLFGTLGMLMFAAGSIIALYLAGVKIAGYDIGHRPLFYIGIVLMITSVQLVTTGFISELLMRTYYGSQNKKPYSILEQFEGSEALPEHRSK